ncbi:MAG: MMPL family transporter [Planctomycetaceae bacterium]|nr:MMPL family transporter [Planctomycetaceae bacterium]
MALAPPWDSVVHDGEFHFLPDDAPSHRAEELFERAFSHDFLGSNIVVVVRRVGGMRREGLRKEDLDHFIEKVLKPRIEQIALDDGGYSDDDRRGSPDDDASASTVVDAAGTSSGTATPSSRAAGGDRKRPRRSVITAVRTHTDLSIGHLLRSEDNQAALVMVNLRTELFADENRETLARIEQLIAPNGTLRDEHLVPAGIDLSISGSATIGRDMRQAEVESARSTEFWTIFLVVSLLLLIYRSPVLAFIPLVTVFLAVKSALCVIALMAGQDLIHPFGGIETYITVVVYGAGVDYCVFLMARYKEELDAGATIDEAVSAAVEKVGAAVVASAATTITGIGMMIFCQFGKFQQAGIGMSLSLVFVLVASLTFTPALMMLFGRWAFWPNMRSERIRAGAGWLSPTRFVSRVLEHDLVLRFWERVAGVVRRSPGRVFAGSFAAMLPFAVIAVVCYDKLSYGLLSELPPDNPSVVGTNAVRDHFSAGLTGPVTLLIHSPNLDFGERVNEKDIQEFTERLRERMDELGLDDIRSLSHPLGVTSAATRAEEENDAQLRELPAPRRVFERGVRRRKIVQHYVSDRSVYAGHVTRMDVVFKTDPFSRDSIRRFEEFQRAVPRLLPDALQPASVDPRSFTQLYYLGPTSSIRDLKRVTGQDQILINILVIASVFVVLVALVRHLAIAAYLIVSVFFSYLVTLGLTYAMFGFAGLDWKVPVFLFTILIAVGEDYNIYLMARIEEETRKFGPIRGTTEALTKTGGIISTCGVIMAGTFASLMSGALTGMNQLGFALSFGVMLDTFVVRPILVPAYLILLHTGRFGRLGQFLGAAVPGRAELPPLTAVQETTST